MPVDTVDLVKVGMNGGYRMCSMTNIPNLDIAIVRGSQDMLVLAIPFDLRSASLPVGKTKAWSTVRTEENEVATDEGARRSQV